ncbi:hypothetical protein IVG45_10690 [Methylomonas sp. LL1]|uniref:hypothetical protein n=1 Tax=Methylomonas sp. LL1 TaxID=2785785 RepID=UPI0018C43541|nr:hypothetical protein [Methylomonas sp. LL1]QPK65357.1 hypothetical protein IVG45_10690 [Methylomonas sp. LL1]
MKFAVTPNLSLVVFCAALSGCAGDRVLFVTKTNVGLDVDTKPPTAEVTVARRELAILPIFPINSSEKAPENKDQGEIIDKNKEKQAESDGNQNSEEVALPLLGAFGLRGNFLDPRITAHFAGGDAAVYLAQESNKPVESSICMQSKPGDTRGWLLKTLHFFTGKGPEEYQTEPRPFYFATDTSYGLKVAWSGTSGPYPDSLKLGYNRKEFASPPIFVNEGCANGKNGWNIKMPSFYASIDNKSGIDDAANQADQSNIWKSATNHVQFFATGQAASEFAKRTSVRQVAFENIAPDAAISEAGSLNRDLIGEIVKTFDMDTADKDAILAKAVELELVPKETITIDFKTKLMANATGINYSVATRLNQLRIIAVNFKKVSAGSRT